MKLIDLLGSIADIAKSEDKDGKELRIDCSKCEREPDYGNSACIRCISGNITDDRRPETIVLVSGVEKQYSGEAARLMCDLSCCIPHGSGQHKYKKCAECKLSPQRIDDEMWNLFSIDAIDLIISRLDSTLAEGKECGNCIADTRNRLQETRNRLYLVSKDALATAYRMTGV